MLTPITKPMKITWPKINAEQIAILCLQARIADTSSSPKDWGDGGPLFGGGDGNGYGDGLVGGGNGDSWDIHHGFQGNLSPQGSCANYQQEANREQDYV